MIPSTIDRVRVNTDESINQQIRCRTEEKVACVAVQGPAAIERRLAELDNEWDIERFLETIAPTFTLLGMTLGVTRSRAWFLLPFLVQGFFLQHALQGWCPPIPILRRLGVRTFAEIDEERYALKALRGDFRHVSDEGSNSEDAASALEAARR